MTELSQSGATNSQQSAADAKARFTTTNKNALHLMFGAQWLMLGEILFAADQMIDRTRTETHLFSEFVSKMAGSHSVKNLRTIYEECGRIRSTSCAATANGCSSTANG